MATLRDHRCRGTLSTWTAVACIAFLLVASGAEALHSCEMDRQAEGPQITVSTADSPARGPCLICINAHSPILVTVFSFVRPESLVATAAAILQTTQCPSIQTFALYVRPPPAL